MTPRWPAGRIRRQRGVSLVEVALSAAVLGACAVLLWGVNEHQVRIESQEDASHSLTRAHDALLAFAYLHGHLPCPAPSTQGLASCTGGDSGFLPYLTIGLPDPGAGRIRYEVSQAAPSLTAGGAYTVIVGRPAGEHGDLAPNDVTLAALSSDRQWPLYDLCASLNGTAQGTLAYGLSADVGDATSAGGPGHGGTGTAAVAPRREQVRVGRSMLAARLGCAPLSASARAHFNTALGARVMARAMRDYRDQFDLGYHTYAADLLQGLWFAADAAYATRRAYTKMLVAKAEAESTSGLHISPYLESQIKLAASGIYAIAMASNVARFTANLVKAKARRETIHDLADSTAATAEEVEQRAILSVTPSSFDDASP